mmetsp:Transcript_111841/g.194155  ORF Transcript_111841/g.194155 Transcript_111841/m.194155 type:complete len:237 (-) Transcript_111841:1669-2379(-)
MVASGGSFLPQNWISIGIPSHRFANCGSVSRLNLRRGRVFGFHSVSWTAATLYKWMPGGPDGCGGGDTDSGMMDLRRGRVGSGEGVLATCLAGSQAPTRPMQSSFSRSYSVPVHSNRTRWRIHRIGYPIHSLRRLLMYLARSLPTDSVLPVAIVSMTPGLAWSRPVATVQVHLRVLPPLLPSPPSDRICTHGFSSAIFSISCFNFSCIVGHVTSSIEHGSRNSTTLQGYAFTLSAL